MAAFVSPRRPQRAQSRAGTVSAGGLWGRTSGMRLRPGGGPQAACTPPTLPELPLTPRGRAVRAARAVRVFVRECLEIGRTPGCPANPAQDAAPRPGRGRVGRAPREQARAQEQEEELRMLQSTQHVGSPSDDGSTSAELSGCARARPGQWRAGAAWPLGRRRRYMPSRATASCATAGRAKHCAAALSAGEAGSPPKRARRLSELRLPPLRGTANFARNVRHIQAHFPL